MPADLLRNQLANTPNEAHELEAPAMDYREHERTYARFVAGVKWSIVILAITVVVLFFVIRP